MQFFVFFIYLVVGFDPRSEGEPEVLYVGFVLSVFGFDVVFAMRESGGK